MKKQTKVMLAATMLTLGASFTAMAATYDWQMEDGQWVCYDADGDVYEDEWCYSNGVQYYVDEDGVLASNVWADEYYVQSDGSKAINCWKYILPADADEDEDDEQWFWFVSKGKVTTGKKVIDGKTYYFDEDGIMLTGWVKYDDGVASEADEYDSSVVYIHEDGSRAKSEWMKLYAPEVDEDEDDVDEDDMIWYYFGSDGKPETGRGLDINGETYFFNKEGHMLSGWVATTDSKTYFDLADLDIDVIGNKEADETVKDNTIAAVKLYDDGNVYFCGDEDEGWAKKSTWIKEYRSNVYADPDSDDDSQYWFWLGSKGKVLVGTDYTAAKVRFYNGDERYFSNTYSTVTTKAAFEELNNKTYAFNQNGEMQSGLVEINGDMYYFGGSNDGSMKTGQVTIEDYNEEDAYTFYFGKNDDNGYTEGVAVTGAAGGDLYVNGLLVTTDTTFGEELGVVAKTSTDNDYVEVYVESLKAFFVIDDDGDIKTSKKSYEDDDDVEYLNTENTSLKTSSGNMKGSYATSAVPADAE